MKKNRYKFKKKKVLYTEKKPFLADKEIIFRSGGRAKVFNISHRLQIWSLLLLTAMLCWSAYSYHGYHVSAKIIHRQGKELGQTRDAYIDLMSDVSALQNNLKEVMASVEEAGSGLKEISAYKDKAEEVEYKMKTMADSQSWLKQEKVEEKITKKEALLQREMAVRENAVLREKIARLAPQVDSLQKNVKGLESAEIAILEKIEKLSGQEIEKIKDSLAEINNTLKVQKQYFNPLSNIKDGKGGAYIPLEGTTISPELQDKMSSTFKQIEKLENYKAAVKSLPLGAPVYRYRLSSSFGGRSDPFKKVLARHKGIDMSATLGSRVSAPASGKVITAGYQNNGYGNLVEIQHGNGFVTKYAHLNKIYVKKGDKVEYNQAIGEVGRTGRATGSHLHYEVLYNGYNVNPLTFVNIGNMNNS